MMGDFTTVVEAQRPGHHPSQEPPEHAREVPPAHGSAKKDGTGVSGLGPQARRALALRGTHTDTTDPKAA